MPPRGTPRGERRDGNGWYRISNSADGGPATILIYDEIGFWGVTASDFIRDLAGVPGPVDVHINSPGGDVFEAYAIYNALAARTGVRTVIDALAASSASVIAMAGEERLMAPMSQTMIHESWAGTSGDSEDLRQMAERLDTVSGQIAGIYAAVAGGDAEHWRDLMRAETWFTPEQAIEAGLATGITKSAREPAAAARASGHVPAGAIAASAPSAPAAPPQETSPPPASAGEIQPVAAAAGESEGKRDMPPEDQGVLTVEGRRARIADINGQLRDLAREYAAQVMPQEVQREWDKLIEEKAGHIAAVDAHDRRMTQLAVDGAGAGGAHDRPLTGEVAGRPAAYGSPAVHIKPDNIYDVSEIRQQAKRESDLPGLYRDYAMRAVEQARFPGSNREQAQTAVARLLDSVDGKDAWLARRVLNTGNPAYKRVFGRAMAAGNPGALGAHDGQVLALGESDTGAYAVPFELDPTIILTSDGVINPLRQVARVERITGKEFDLVSSQGVTVSWDSEFNEAPDSTPVLAQPTIKPEKVHGFIPFSVELEQDWTALQAEMMRLLADAKDVAEATNASGFVLGDGTAPNAGGLITTLPAGSVVTAGGTGTFTVDDVYKVKNAVPPRFRARGSFLAESSIYDKVRQFGTGTMANVWVDLGGATPPKLIGYQARELSAMDNTVASGKKILMFGDYQQFLIVDRLGMNTELVPHLFGTTRRYPTGTRGYYCWWRTNSVILVPNAFRLLKVG